MTTERPSALKVTFGALDVPRVTIGALNALTVTSGAFCEVGQP